MLRYCILTVLSLTLISSSGVAAKGVTRTVSVDETFGAYELNWSRSGGLKVRYSPMNVEGKLEFCVVYLAFPAGRKMVLLNKSALKEARIYVDDQLVLRDLTFANRVSNKHKKSRMVGQSANCVSTGKPFPTEAFRYRIQIRRGKYRATL